MSHVLRRVQLIIAAGMLLGVGLSWPLWLSDRFYPMVPVLSSLQPAAAAVNNLVFAVFAVSLIGLLVRGSRRTITVAVVSLAVLLVFDQTRWQPWVYLYGAMMSVLLFAKRDGSNHAAIRNTLCFMVVALYVWSGVQKMNMGFFAGVFPWFLEPFISGVPQPFRMPLYMLGLLVPFAEAGAALGLLASKTRRSCVIALIAMHALILLSISPVGHNWNAVVWPWNVAMMLLVYALFWHESADAKQVVVNDRSYVHAIVVLLFGFMPVLSFFGVWDSYLSFTLYAGNNNEGKIFFGGVAAVPEQLMPYAKTGEQGTFVDLFDWTIGELGVPRYPEARVMKRVFTSVCGVTEKQNGPTLVIEGKQYLWIGQQSKREYLCDDVQFD